MCEFCENVIEWDADEYDLVQNKLLSEGMLREKTTGTYQVGTFNSYYDFWETMEINYCPMCGRKLV